VSQANNEKVVLDANVLYPAPLRDFLLNLAFLNCYVPCWTEQIQFEWMDNLLKNRKDLKNSQLKRTVKLMNEAFPHANIKNYSNLEKDLVLPDENDKHVLAAAIKSKSRIIVTFNIKDFPIAILDKFKIKRFTPDDFVLMLFKRNESLVLQALENQLKSLRNPPKTRSELLNTLKVNNLKKTIALIKKSDR